MSGEYDGVILGAGHNSLVLQAYASRAGLATICLERSAQPGGGLATDELPTGSGFWHNTHAFFHRAVTAMPWYVDLGLARCGARYVHPELNVVLVTRGGRCLEWWTDFERTVASVASFSGRDAESLRRWRSEFLPILRDILIPEAQSPPLPPDLRRQLLLRSASGRRLLEVSRLSPLEFVERHFQHPLVRAGLLFFNGLREVDLRLAGFGHHIPALLASDTLAQACLGGSRRLGEALVAAVTRTGGEVATGVQPRRILARAGRAVGVETEDGDVFHARRFVASSLNPQQTFLDLLAPADVPDEWHGKAERFSYNLLAPLFGLYLNLDEPPKYRALERQPHSISPLMVILGLEDDQQFHEIVRHHQAGTIPPAVMWGACPTLFDSSQAPAGRHTAFMWEKVPFRLNGDARNWERYTGEHAQRMQEVWSEYAPNLGHAILDRFARSPLDTERRLPNMRDGDLLVGAFAQGQIGFHRPFPGAGHYRTHLEGLYLCGSCCHPGGNVTGLPGYNCAQVLLADCGLPRLSAAPPIEQRLASLGDQRA